MQPGKARFVARPQIDDGCAFDQAARFQINAFLAVFQGQLDAVADQWFTGKDFIITRPEGGVFLPGAPFFLAAVLMTGAFLMLAIRQGDLAADA